MSDLKKIVNEIGRPRICENLGVTEPAISNAIAQGYFPANWYPSLRDLGRSQGVAIPEELFNWKKPAKSQEHTAA